MFFKKKPVDYSHTNLGQCIENGHTYYIYGESDHGVNGNIYIKLRCCVCGYEKLNRAEVTDKERHKAFRDAIILLKSQERNLMNHSN